MEDIEIEKGIFLTGEGLAVFKSIGVAVAADLHIGFEEAMGQSLARIQTKRMLSKCISVLGRFGIKEIVLNGDLKYSFGKKSKSEWEEVKYFIRELSKKAKILVVKGNHDFYIESMVKGLEMSIAEEFQINNVLFTHGNIDMEPSEANITVIGNDHPSIRFRDEAGAARKYPIFIYAKRKKVLVLPALNPWAPGTDILSTRKGDFLSPILNKINMEEARVYPIESGQIYDFKNVKGIRAMLGKPGENPRPAAEEKQ